MSGMLDVGVPVAARVRGGAVSLAAVTSDVASGADAWALARAEAGCSRGAARACAAVCVR